MLRDHLLSSYSDSNSGQYGNLPAIEYTPTLDSQPHDYPDLSQINTEDLMPLCAEPSQSLSQLIEQECNDNDNQVIHQIHQILPDLEEHEKCGIKFELNLDPQQRGKLNWFYSKKFNKVYIKLNGIFNIEAVYSPLLNNEKLYMRVMMVFNSEVSEPVVRCKNHSSTDSALEKNIKHSVLRCENPNVTYLGTVEGKNVSDRLSVRIPLGCVKPNEDNLIKQTVALKFVCQNSCVGRRETSIIFYLENANGEILAKRITAVKICSCPKRDMKKDEEAELPKKRTKKDSCPIGKKIMKLESDQIKEEAPQDNDDNDDGSETNDIAITPSGVKLNMKFRDINVAINVIECAFNRLAGQMALNPAIPVKTSDFRGLKNTLEKLQRLRDEQK